MTVEQKAVFYGRAGTGKTTLAASFPGPALLIDCKDKGTDSVLDVKGLKVYQADSFVEVEQMFWYLHQNPKKFKTVILDTVSQIQDLAIRHVIAEKGGDVLEPGKWGTMKQRDWGDVSSLLKSLITNYRDLPMNVVFIAQDRVFNVSEESDTDEEQITPEVGPRLMPSIASHLNAAVSLIGNTYIREHTKKVRDGKGKMQEKKSIQYCLRIGPHAYYTTKVRKPKSVIVPQTIYDPDYSKIMECLEGE